MTGLKNIYIYSENNIFVFSTDKRARRHNNRDYGVLSNTILSNSKRNVKPMKKLEKSIAVCLYVGVDIYESTGKCPNISPKIVPRICTCQILFTTHIAR